MNSVPRPIIFTISNSLILGLVYVSFFTSSVLAQTTNDYEFITDTQAESIKLDTIIDNHDYTNDVNRTYLPDLSSTQSSQFKICDMKENKRVEEVTGTLSVDFKTGGSIFGTAKNNTIYNCWYWVGLTYYEIPAGGDPMDGLNLQRFVEETPLVLLAPGESTSFELFLPDDADSLCRIQADVHIGPSVNPFSYPDGEPGINWYSDSYRLVKGKVIGTPYCADSASLSRIRGLIWDATDSSCNISDTDKNSLEIQPNDVEDGVEVFVSGDPNIYGTWDPNDFSGYSYEINNVPIADNSVICGSVSTPTSTPNAFYRLKCVDNSDSGVQTSACAIKDIDDLSENINLGYELVSTGWFTSLFGDIYGGCSDCFHSVDAEIPSDIVSGTDTFKTYLIQQIGTVFGNRDLSVVNPDGEDRYSEDNNRYQKNIRSQVATWPTSYNFKPPVGAISIEDNELGISCNTMFSTNKEDEKLNPMRAYKASSSCIEGALNGASETATYSLSKNGVVVIYVTDGDLNINKNIHSVSPYQRIIFVVSRSVIFDSTLNTIYPLPTTRPNIEASFIVNGNIVFSSQLGANDADIIFDLPIIVESPLISKEGTVIFARDGRARNELPVEVVKYNPYYYLQLVKQELSEDNLNRNYSGLFQEGLTWEYGK